MKTMSAREAKNGFGLMIDTARASPVLVEKHGRGVVVVMAVEEYERLKDIEAGGTQQRLALKARACEQPQRSRARRTAQRPSGASPTICVAASMAGISKLMSGDAVPPVHLREPGRLSERQERRAGSPDFDYATLSDANAEFGRTETVKEKGSYILPSSLFPTSGRGRK